MKIWATYIDMLSGEKVRHLLDDATSPAGGYTPAYLAQFGKDAEMRVCEEYNNHYLEFSEAHTVSHSTSSSH